MITLKASSPATVVQEGRTAGTTEGTGLERGDTVRTEVRLERMGCSQVAGILGSPAVAVRQVARRQGRLADRPAVVAVVVAVDRAETKYTGVPTADSLCS